LRWVESSGGSIRLESRPKQGTRTLVLLPVATQTVQEQPVETRKAAQ
jgi:chemotaxis protein histidine kinase CheA